MKTLKILSLIILLMVNTTVYSQFKINVIKPALFGQRSSLTNIGVFNFGSDIIKAGGLSLNLAYAVNLANDTNFTFNKTAGKVFGQYEKATNKGNFIIGSDTLEGNKLSAQFIYLLNPDLPSTTGNNNFTGTNYFRKLIADTVTINNIAKANSTYWINGTDTLGWVDAARSDVVFFPQMKVGTLTTNTTVANNFVRTNQVQTDTLTPHSPLIINGDSLMCKGLYADKGYFKALFSTSGTITDSVINCSLSNNFTKTLSGNQRFVFTNFNEGQVINVAITNTTSNYTVSWINSDGCNIKWSYGSAPTQTIGDKTDLYSFIRIGTIIYGTVIQNF